MSRKRKYTEIQRDAFAFIYLLQPKVTIDRIANYFCMLNRHGKPDGSNYRQQALGRLEELNNKLWTCLDAEAAMQSPDDKRGGIPRATLAAHYREFFNSEKQARLMPILRQFLRDKSLNERTERMSDLSIPNGVLSSDAAHECLVDPLHNNIAYEDESTELTPAERVFSYEDIEKLVVPAEELEAK